MVLKNILNLIRIYKENHFHLHVILRFTKHTTYLRCQHRTKNVKYVTAFVIILNSCTLRILHKICLIIILTKQAMLYKIFITLYVISISWLCTCIVILQL